VPKDEFSQYWGFVIMDRFESGDLFQALALLKGFIDNDHFGRKATALKRAISLVSRTDDTAADWWKDWVRETALQEGVPLQLSREQLLSFVTRGDDRLIAGCWNGRYKGRPQLIATLRAEPVAAKEFRQGTGFGCLHVLQRGPRRQNIADHWSIHFFEPLQDLREEHLQLRSQPVQIPRLVVYCIAPGFHQELNRTRSNCIGSKWPQPIRVFSQQFQNQIGISGITLGTGWVETFSIVIHRARVNWIQDQMAVFAQHEQKRAAGLLHGHSDHLIGKPSAQFGKEFFYSFRCVINFSPPDTLFARDLHGIGVLLISPVDSDPDCDFRHRRLIGLCVLHSSSLYLAR